MGSLVFNQPDPILEAGEPRWVPSVLAVATFYVIFFAYILHPYNFLWLEMQVQLRLSTMAPRRDCLVFSSILSSRIFGRRHHGQILYRVWQTLAYHVTNAVDILIR